MKNIMISIEEEQKLEELCQYAFECARSDDTHTLKILLDSGLNVNLANHQGASHYCESGRTGLRGSCKAESCKTFQRRSCGKSHPWRRWCHQRIRCKPCFRFQRYYQDRKSVV